jgi:hypothetical protein
MHQSNEQAMAMVAGGGTRPPPQLYSAPDPEEDPEAQKAMENLATLAAQVWIHHHHISSSCSLPLSLPSGSHGGGLWQRDAECYSCSLEPNKVDSSPPPSPSLDLISSSRDFFQHGVMPKAGLDELDEFILKKIGLALDCLLSS